MNDPAPASPESATSPAPELAPPLSSPPPLENSAAVTTAPEAPPLGSVPQLPPLLLASSSPASAEPPLLRAAATTPAKLSRWFIAAVVLVGAVQLLFSVKASSYYATDPARRIGFVIGTTTFWPLVAIGLFSLSRRFRTPRTRATILLVLWSLALFSNLASTLARNLPRGHTFKPPIAGPRQAGKADILSPQDMSFAEWKPDDSTKVTPAFEFSTGSDFRPAPDQSAAASKPVDSAGITRLFDFSKGSDERLIKLIESAQEERYHQIESEYVKACAKWPQDAVLALERVKFVEHFAYAEDVTIESATKDHDAAVHYLKTTFPNAPGTVLYDLRNVYDDDFERKVQAYALLTRSWSPADRAQFFLLRANAAQTNADSARVLRFARASFAEQPTVAAGLLLARAAMTAGAPDEAIQTLSNGVFTAAEPWFRKQKMDLLFELHRTDLAVPLFLELKRLSPQLVKDPATALHLAQAGRVDEGREILLQQPARDWNRRNRFEFELQFGNAEQAGAGYRALRDGGMRFDPVAHDRFALFRKHPGVGWTLQDALGVLTLLGLLVGACLSPGVLLLPAHYWSLLRQRSGKIRGWPGSSWGLREAWIAFAAVALAEVVAIWIYQPGVLRSWWGDHQATAGLTDQTRIELQGLDWTLTGLVLLFLVWRARAWRAFGSGAWSVGKAFALALAFMMILRLSLGVYVLIWPKALSGEFASVTSDTAKLCFALLAKLGPVGLIAVVAGLVPVLEELLFRGVLLQALAKHVPFGWANGAQALLFAAIHENLALSPFFFAFGLVSGEITRRSNGLLAGIILHSSNNFLACVALIFLKHVGSASLP
jgi:membrane protease YdiL (CAAX protease family)